MSPAGPRPTTARWVGSASDESWAEEPAAGGRAARGRRPRPGWYAYRPTAPARLPPWAVEVALTVERPADPGLDPAPTHPADEPSAEPAQPRRWEAPEQSSRGWEGGPAEDGSLEALLLLRAAGRGRLLEEVAGVAGELEVAAGLRPAEPRVRLLSGPPLPGLTPMDPAAACAHLAMAGWRGLPAPLRRRQPAAWTDVTWRSSAGSVLTCASACGMSAQALITLRGLGRPAGISPPPGGAVVLRAWKGRRAWGLACGLVLGAPEMLGLGREAGRAAAAARGEGWDAAVVRGPAALQLARAGDPGHPPPESIAGAASTRQVSVTIDTCLAAAGLDDPAVGPAWTLAVTS